MSRFPHKKLQTAWDKWKWKLLKGFLAAVVFLYFYGMVLHAVFAWAGQESSVSVFTANPIACMRAVFSLPGLQVTAILFIAYLFCSGKGRTLLGGQESVQDTERGLEILPEGTHGTSGWMDKKAIKATLQTGRLSSMDATVFGRLENGDYVGVKELPGMSRNVMVYGAPGTGKSRGFVMPFILQAARRGESLVICDPKAEFYEMYAEYLRGEGFFVKSYNLLDLEASDGWNCLMDSAKDTDLVQHIAEIIIRNTSADSEREDFWSKAEKNLLMALIHFIQTRTYPNSDRLLPEEERSLGAIYKLIASTTVQELDAQFRALPPGHPALPPYGIFRQAPHNIWGNIFIGLGSRLNVFQNKLVDAITKHNEIDLELPGKQKCAYFCIISDQDDTLRFLSSMFFSVLFIKLFNFARRSENRRLPVRVNVLMDEFCNLDLPNSKKWLSVSRSRNCDIQCVAQSISQLADRYPKTQWQELVGDCDYQLFLGCNDAMTASYISEQCGSITVRVQNENVPARPGIPSALGLSLPYSRNKVSTGRPLMMPDEVRRLPRNRAILLIRGAKPLLLYKISPEEHPAFRELKPCKAIDHIPEWRKRELEKKESPERGPAEPEQKIFPDVSPVQAPAEESEEYLPDEEELELHPKIDLSQGIDCKTLTEVSPEDV